MAGNYTCDKPSMMYKLVESLCWTPEATVIVYQQYSNKKKSNG